MGYSSIAWLPLCAGLTVLGLAASYVAWRRRGRLSALRGAAWSLLPVAAYLTGSVEMFWKIGAAIGHYADGFVFSPVKWAGVAVAGVSALLFFATSGRQRRRAARLARGAARPKAAPSAEPGAVTSSATQDLDIAKILRGSPATASTNPSAPKAPEKAARPAKSAKPAKAAPSDDDDMKDIEEILRKRGL